MHLTVTILRHLARLLGSGMQLDAELRPRLLPFLAELDAFEP